MPYPLNPVIQDKIFLTARSLTRSSRQASNRACPLCCDVFKVAIGESRIVSVENRIVTFTYKKHGSNRIRTMSLDVLEFIRRFLQHVLPSGFMKVRYYGFMHPSCKIPIRETRKLVQQHSHTEGQEAEVFKDVKAGQLYCPDCGGLLIVVPRMIPFQPELCDSG